MRKIRVFYFDILYKKGKENIVIDCLSRNHESGASICGVSLVVPKWISKVQIENVKDPETRKLIEEVESNKETNSKYSLEKDILWYKKGYIYLIPQNSKFRS